MTTIPQSNTDFHHSMRHFSKLVHLSEVLRSCNVNKSRGVRVSDLFEWIIGTIFARYSFERADVDPGFTTKTVRNCLNDARTNWQRLVMLLGIHLINYIQRFTDKRRAQALILDDSLFKREFSKRTELLARVFDHDNQRYYNGFRTLTLGWSDGNTFLPLNFALMSSAKKENQLGPAKIFDGRTLAAKRRAQAHRKMSNVAVELVEQALKAGSQAKFVLFDSWFTSPKMFARLNALGVDGLGMLKRSDKVYFRYRGRQMTVKSLFERLRKSRYAQHDGYLYSPIVKFEVDGQIMPVKLVFVSNRRDASQFLVLGTTKTTMKPDEIIQMYGRRWQIEGFFKVGKQYLQFDHTQTQSYDGLCGHLAMVMMSYDILALCQRENIDERSLGDLFFEFGRALPDLDLSKTLKRLMTLFSGIAEKSPIDSRTVNEIITQFMQTLPSNLVGLLDNAA
ncbi:IS4 family transposase [Limosilactobacillus fermentum]|uniref:IS4 family transposase n=1 Tax=Limosilactobacillus fermentum TaxID=1613 RepID=UPI003F004167